MISGFVLGTSTISLLCADSGFAFARTLPTGTYKVYVTDAALPITADTTGKVLDVKTVNLAGSVTLNGGAPMETAACTASPNLAKTEVRFFETRPLSCHGYGCRSQSRRARRRHTPSREYGKALR